MRLLFQEAKLQLLCNRANVYAVLAERAERARRMDLFEESQRRNLRDSLHLRDVFPTWASGYMLRTLFVNWAKTQQRRSSSVSGRRVRPRTRIGSCTAGGLWVKSRKDGGWEGQDASCAGRGDE